VIRVKRFWFLALAAVLLFSMSASAFGEGGFEPTERGVVPRYADEGELGSGFFFVECEGEQFKFDDLDKFIEDPAPGGVLVSDPLYIDEVEGYITLTISEDGYFFDFVSDFLVMKVQVKGGGEPLIYDYVPGFGGVYWDNGLYAAPNPGGQASQLSNIVFCFTYDGNGGEKAALSGSKWYDLDMDGVWDLDEDGLAGWKISLYKWVEDAWVWQADTLTNDEGGYSFADLDPGTYKVEEGAVSGKWIQTFPLDPNYHEVVIEEDDVADKDFGNVCKRDAVGYTMGFWSNKNGTAAINAWVAGGGVLPHGWSTKDIQALFRQAAKATDMCVMLKAQYAAHWLNINVPVNGKVADYSGAGVIINGEVVSYDEFLADFDVHDCADYTRAEAEGYKDFFDGLNNNWFDLVEYEPCPVPEW
jgi:hypothetical protein